MIADEALKSQHREVLETQFMDKLGPELCSRLRDQAKDEVRRQDLIDRSGLHDARLLEELVHQGVTPESLIALRLVPLVMVAWSDLSVTDEERMSVMTEAAKLGIGEDTIPGRALQQWLRIRPDWELAQAWQHYAHMLLRAMSPELREVYIGELRREMYAIAMASGGHLGIGKINEAEQYVIDRFTRMTQSADHR